VAQVISDTAFMSTPKWYSIKARSNATRAAEVFVYGDIGESWWGESVTAAEFVREIAALDVDELTVRINSYGGSVSDGLAIYNALRRHKARVTTSIEGLAASIASLIAMAGDSVEMAENSLLMIHAPWGGATGNAQRLRDYADMLDKWAGAMASSYVAKTGREHAEMLTLLTDGDDHWYTAAEAQAGGFVDAISEALPVAAALMKPSRFTPPNSQAARAAQSSAPAESFVPKEHHMPAENTAAPVQPTPAVAAGQPTPAVTEADIRARVLAEDKARRDGIASVFGRFTSYEGVPALLAQLQDDPTCTPEAAGQKLLAHLGANEKPIAGRQIFTLEDEGDKRAEAVAASLMVRAGVAGKREREIAAASGLGARTLLSLAEASLARAGVSTSHMSKMDVVAAAFTQGTADFPILLETAMHKTLQQAYALAPDTWSRFCKIGSVTDFRANGRYRVGGLSNLDTVNEFGEFKNKSIPDGEKGSVTATTKGNIINLTRQAIVNDDLGAFIGLAASLGRAARRTVEAAVYALLAENSGLGPTQSDNQPLFHSNRKNVGIGAALTVASIDADRAVMAAQTGVGGTDYLDLRPAILLVPTGYAGTARVINDAQYDPDTANKLQRPNAVRGLFRDIVDTPRLAGTRYYMFADPAEAPVIEVAFLDGVQEPAIEMERGFDVDGTRYKVRLDFGVAAIDWRGAVTNAGTA
jgi:ATP-dependent Clp endopeptidase proteolytic subunit ClpP